MDSFASTDPVSGTKPNHSIMPPNLMRLEDRIVLEAAGAPDGGTDSSGPDHAPDHAGQDHQAPEPKAMDACVSIRNDHHLTFLYGIRNSQFPHLRAWPYRSSRPNGPS